MGSKLDVSILTINSNGIGDLHEYANIETLIIRNVVLREDEIRAIFTPLAGMRVQRLELSYVDIDDGELNMFIPLLAECSSLRELDIHKTSIRDPAAIYNLLQMPLTRLRISNVDIGDRGAEKIALAMYQNQTPRILEIIARNYDITAAGWVMIRNALRNNTSLIGLIAGGSEEASAIMTPAIEQNDRLHFFDTVGLECERQINHVATPGTLRFAFGDSEDLVWRMVVNNLERLVFARFPVELHAPALQLALDQRALYQKIALPSLPAAVHRVLRNAISRSRVNANDDILKMWELGSTFVEWDIENEQQVKIADNMDNEVTRLEGMDFDLIPDARVLYPFRDEILKLSPWFSTSALVHPADTEWQARLADAAGVTVLVCVPDDTGAAAFEALAARYTARNYSVAIIGKVTPRMVGTAERYLPAARRVFGAADVLSAVRSEELQADIFEGRAIRDLLVYRECLASNETLLAPDEADRVAMRCGFGPGNWARVARFPGVWTLPGVGVAPDAGRFLAHLDKWLAPTSGAVLATSWPVREGAAFAARLRDFLVSPVHLAKIVREANELVAVPSVDAVVDALAALGVVHRVAGHPLLVVRGSRPDALAALHARLLSRPDEFQRIVLRDGVIDFQHAGGRYTADAADGVVRITGAGGRLVPLALRQALQIGPHAAAAAKRRAL